MGTATGGIIGAMGVGQMRRLFFVATALVLAPAVVVLGLIVADWTEIHHRARDPLTAVALTIDRGDRLHYVGHLMLGRALDLCACADHVAADQYDRATWHARTARQLALVTYNRPRAPLEWVTDGAGAITSGARWGERGSLWLVGRLARLIEPGRDHGATRS